ncbi:MAG: hypothetical protein FJ404_17275 [Verrucomicrobia bacterium]|nr:hypothetical protein [Verrucomicrobiota bacterium]
MDHRLHVLKRGPLKLQRKPSEYLRSISLDIVSPLPEAMRSGRMNRPSLKPSHLPGRACSAISR